MHLMMSNERPSLWGLVKFYLGHDSPVQEIKTTLGPTGVRNAIDFAESTHLTKKELDMAVDGMLIAKAGITQENGHAANPIL